MTPTLLRASCAFAGLAALAACGPKDIDPRTQFGPNPVLPPPHQYLIPPMKVPPLKGWRTGDKPTVPAGVEIRPLATGFLHPRMVYTLPNGDILVVESNGPKAPVYRLKDYIEGKVKAIAGSAGKGGNRITLLRDANGDGVPELRTIFLDHLTSPFGVVLVGNDLYVANTDAIMRFPYVAGETRITAPGSQVTELPGGPIDHHWTKSLTASPDGSKLYVGVGSNSNITENGLAAEYGRAAVWEVDRATGMKRIFASGLRNPTGLAIEPTTGQLWAIVNERDEIGPDLVPDYMTAVKENAFYGWPYSYYGQHVDVRAQPQRPDLVAKAIPPDYALSSHVAVLGIAFTQGTSLPEPFRNGVFLAFHGSWDRSPLNGYKVIYVPFQAGRPAGGPRDLVTNFVAPDGRSKGRPVGLALDKTGALLIADDVGNTVWRVTPAAGGAASAQASRAASAAPAG